MVVIRHWTAWTVLLALAIFSPDGHCQIDCEMMVLCMSRTHRCVPGCRDPVLDPSLSSTFVRLDIEATRKKEADDGF